MSRRYQLKQWTRFTFVLDAETGAELGFYAPPQGRDFLLKAQQPELIDNLEDFPELAGHEYFGIYPLGVDAEWKKLGFSVVEALDWTHNGKMRKPTTAKQWRDAGFESPEETHIWRNVLPKPTAELAARLRALDFDPKEVANWSRYSRITAADIPPWLEQGFERQDAGEWSKQGFPAQEARKLADSGFKAADAKRWKESGIEPQLIHAWLEAGFDASSAMEWSSYGIDAPDEARKWLDSNLEVQRTRLVRRRAVG